MLTLRSEGRARFPLNYGRLNALEYWLVCGLAVDKCACLLSAKFEHVRRQIQLAQKDVFVRLSGVLSVNLSLFVCFHRDGFSLFSACCVSADRRLYELEILRILRSWCISKDCWYGFSLCIRAFCFLSADC